VQVRSIVKLTDLTALMDIIQLILYIIRVDMFKVTRVPQGDTLEEDTLAMAGTSRVELHSDE
jgi:hypothetical protein